MVNLTKRIHRLMPLWSVKSGAGAAILPPKPPAPKLTHLRLQLPNPCNGYDNGARTFWKTFLPSLRYHNLTLPITVDQKLKPGPSFSPTMTLQFESQNKQDLESMETKPEISDAQSLEVAKARILMRNNQEKMAAIEAGKPLPQKTNNNTWVDVLMKEQESLGAPQGITTIGEIQVKPQPAADPSAPSSTTPPSTVYTREITLALRGRSPGQIFSYFKQVTKARQYFRSVPDRRAKRNMDRFFVRADEDRQRVKAGMDAMKREKEDLKRAREAADRLASEA